MADRYWVGGTDTWNGTALLKWSTTSGGVGGAVAYVAPVFKAMAVVAA
jgi:hypothetical protein